MFKIIFYNTLIITLILIVQLSLIAGLPSVFSNLNLILINLINILIIKKFDLAIYYSIAFGFLLDIFFFAPFGFHIIIFIILTLLGNSLLNNFFADRSIYSFSAIGAITTIVYALFIKISQYIIIIFTKEEIEILFNHNFFINLISALILNLIFIIFVFQLINAIHKGLRPIFLESINK